MFEYRGGYEAYEDHEEYEGGARQAPGSKKSGIKKTAKKAAKKAEKPKPKLTRTEAKFVYFVQVEKDGYKKWVKKSSTVYTDVNGKEVIRRASTDRDGKRVFKAFPAKHTTILRENRPEVKKPAKAKGSKAKAAKSKKPRKPKAPKEASPTAAFW
jgi:hypothetical protein